MRFMGGNGIVRLAEFEQEGTSPPVTLQHSNVDLWLMGQCKTDLTPPALP